MADERKFIFTKSHIIDLVTKIIKKAKENNFFERKIHCTRTKSGQLTLGSVNNNTSTWKSYNAVAPASGWYWAMIEGGSNTARAAWIECSGVHARASLSNNGRNLGAGPIWVMKGQTVYWSCVYCAPYTVYYSPSYEY